MSARIYFILEPKSNRLKIGVADEIGVRFNQIADCSPQKLELVHSFPGDVDVERELHVAFSRLFQQENEWYSLSHV